MGDSFGGFPSDGAEDYDEPLGRATEPGHYNVLSRGGSSREAYDKPLRRVSTSRHYNVLSRGGSSREAYDEPLGLASEEGLHGDEAPWSGVGQSAAYDEPAWPSAHGADSLGTAGEAQYGVPIPLQAAEMSEGYGVVLLCGASTYDTCAPPLQDPEASTATWYLTGVDRAQAEQLLARKGNGVFLVRNRGEPGKFALSMVWQGAISHHRLEVDSGLGCKVNGKPLEAGAPDSLEGLVALLQRKRGHDMPGVLGVGVRHPRSSGAPGEETVA
jgi:hypothetical protein